MALFVLLLIIRNDIGRPAPYPVMSKGERDAQLERDPAPRAPILHQRPDPMVLGADGGGNQ